MVTQRQLAFACFCVAWIALGAGAEGTPALRVDPGHPWRPPFGLDRVGQPTRLVLEPLEGLTPKSKAFLVAYNEGREISRQPLDTKAQSALSLDVDPAADRAALIVGVQEPWQEVASLAIERQAFEACAEAKLDEPVNPTDLGAVFPPADWLILAPGRAAHVRVAAFRRDAEIPGAKVVAWFEAHPAERVEAALTLQQGKRSEIELRLPAPLFDRAEDLLDVAIIDGQGAELWRQSIHVMLVKEPPTWPRFGAVESLLRYPLPISVRSTEDGTLSTMPYEGAWPERLHDVVVALPNGNRFVFWRGSSYVPFWAGRGGGGLCYEWAETGPLPEGFVDSVEPLMDKELRYGRVSIVESTSARVHVRWQYQSCDFNYKVWGDAAQEDFFFYPDGFGTRVLTLTSHVDADYELSEFILLAPPEAYPFDVVPPNPIRCLALDGTAGTVEMPFVAEKAAPGPRPPLVYRVHFDKGQDDTAVYFNPRDPFRVEQLVTFRPFVEGGCMVTPAYWGSHWPLARGKTTGWSTDDRIHVSPSHNSLMSWARNRPEPIWNCVGPALDTLGHARTMRTQRWAWMLGVTDESDEHLLARARSFAEPASLELQGAETAVESYSVERRAYRIIVREDAVDITVKPTAPCVNPAFELIGAPKTLVEIRAADRVLGEGEYAWDGQTLWLGIEITQPTQLHLAFQG